MRELSDKLKAENFEAHLEKLPTLQRHFISMILRNANKSRRGHRYTPDERLLCMSIYKKSAAAYRYMCTFLPLPTPNKNKMKFPRNVKKKVQRVTQSK